MKYVLSLILAFSIFGCCDKRKCVKGHTRIVMMYNAALKMMTPTTIYICDRYEKKTPENYTCEE
jgi:hypothetical protein